MSAILPIRHQAELPMAHLIRAEHPGPDAVEMDVLFVGAGPAGLAGSIELARLIAADGTLGEVGIGVLEKAESLGEHNLSGAVVNPRAFQEPRGPPRWTRST
jgi:electron-transferring-flavoprotein dehydrogenase